MAWQYSVGDVECFPSLRSLDSGREVECLWPFLVPFCDWLNFILISYMVGRSQKSIHRCMITINPFGRLIHKRISRRRSSTSYIPGSHTVVEWLCLSVCQIRRQLNWYYGWKSVPTTRLGHTETRNRQLTTSEMIDTSFPKNLKISVHIGLAYLWSFLSCSGILLYCMPWLV